MVMVFKKAIIDVIVHLQVHIHQTRNPNCQLNHTSSMQSSFYHLESILKVLVYTSC
jgi:hypothetical protein